MIVRGVTRDRTTITLYDGPVIETKIVVGESEADLAAEARELDWWQAHGRPFVNSQGWWEQLFVKRHDAP